MRIKILYIFSVIALLVIIAAACASIGSISGGPKDRTPPVMVEAKPADHSINFNGKRIEITFDEFIQLKDISKNFVISPPMKKKPVVTLRNNKNVLVNFDEDLKPNTTYTLYFGNSIVDLNEGNPLKNFEFVFSTGSIIDSLTFRGKVLNAFDHKPDKDGLYVMLYTHSGDTIPRKTLPEHITKTNDKGWFTLSHLEPDTFLIFGLKDMNSNYLFDLPNEEIAFSDTLIPINSSYYIPADTSKLPIKVLKFKSDTVAKDTTDIYTGVKPQIILYNFVEERVLKQRFLKYDRSQPNKLQLIFNNPVTDSLGIYPLNFEAKTDWLLEDPPVPNDTMNYWITDTSLVNKDSLKIILTYPYLDSLQQEKYQSDTVNLVYKEQKLKGRRAAAKPKYNKLSVTLPGANKQAVDLNDKLYFEASEPLISVDLDKISLWKFEDTLKLPVKFTLTTDSQFIRRYYLNFPLEPNYKYQLIADTMAFTNVYHQNSDSIGFQFHTQKDDYYGRIFLTVDSVSGPVIVQLLNEKDDVLRQLFITKAEKLTFDYLAPGKYKFKTIHDWNDNKKWDTGNWGKRLEPEPVEYFDKIITVRSNWDDEEEWTLLEK